MSSAVSAGHFEVRSLTALLKESHGRYGEKDKAKTYRYMYSATNNDSWGLKAGHLCT